MFLAAFPVLKQRAYEGTIDKNPYLCVGLPFRDRKKGGIARPDGSERERVFNTGRGGESMLSAFSGTIGKTAVSGTFAGRNTRR